MNIYDEALEELKSCGGDYVACCDCALENTKIYKAIKYAQKEHKLVGWQRTWIDMTYSPYIREKLWVKITKLEKELGEMK